MKVKLVKYGISFKFLFFCEHVCVCQWTMNIDFRDNNSMHRTRSTTVGNKHFGLFLASRQKLFSGIDWSEIFVLLKWMIKHVFILIVGNRVNVHHSLIVHFQNVMEADMGKTVRTPVDSALTKSNVTSSTDHAWVDVIVVIGAINVPNVNEMFIFNQYLK